VGIELRHLRYTIAAADAGSFRAAASVLNIEQSALSRRIRDLEVRLGAPLFVRYHGGVRLTEAGEKFVVRARNALSQIRHAVADAASLGRGITETVRIGIISSFASGFLSNLIRTYVEACPKVWIGIVESTPASHLAAVQQHLLDIAFLFGQHAAIGCESRHLWDEQVIVALPAAHRLAMRFDLSWQDLHGETFIVREAGAGLEVQEFITANLNKHGCDARVERQAIGRDSLLHLVAMGRGITLAGDALTAASFPGVTYRPLRDEVWSFSAIWSSSNRNFALKTLLNRALRSAAHSKWSR